MPFDAQINHVKFKASIWIIDNAICGVTPKGAAASCIGDLIAVDI
jgi:hypothetical protein